MKLKINFSLKSGVKGEIPLIVNINFGYKEFDEIKRVFVYKPLRYYTGIKLQRHEWDEIFKKPIPKDKLIEFIKIEEMIKEIYHYLKLKNDISLESFKEELDEKLKGKDKTKIESRVRIVDFIKNEILTSNSIIEKSKQPYKDLSNKLIEFEKKIGKPLYSNEINETIFLSFMDDIKKNMNRINSVWKVQKVFKSTMNKIARKYKIKVFDISQELSSKDKVQSVSIDAIYLNFEQIKKIIDHNPKTEKLKNIKLILLTLLFTGCRESDVYKIKLQHLYDKNGEKFYYAHYFSQKTDTEIIIPILQPLVEAFEQNGGFPAYPVSQQKFNEYVKILVEDAELKEDITITYVDAKGKKRFETKKLFDFVSSHIGRRSFVTNLINHIPITILTKITGHALRDKSIIFGYNKISLIDNAVEFRKKLRQAVIEHPDHFVIKLI